MAGRRTRWKGWIRRAEVEPELLAKFEQYKEIYQSHFRLGSVGTGNPLQAHFAALREVPLTADEQEILKRLEPEMNMPQPPRDEEPDRETRPPFDARAWMIENGIDPDTEVIHVSKSDPNDPEVTVWGWEHRNVVTGQVVQFEETRRVRFVRMKF